MHVMVVYTYKEAEELSEAVRTLLIPITIGRGFDQRTLGYALKSFGL